MNLDTHGIIGPVTALCVYRNTVFAGCGSRVQVYNSDTCDLLTSLPALHSAAVHGFELVLGGRKCLCVYGAKHIRIFYLDVEALGGNDTSTAHFVRLQAATAATEFEDWIWATAWLQDHENADRWTLALALAHNVILHWDWQTNTVLHKVTCTEKCILYCAHFIGHRWSDVVLAAGTVFNQVVLWSPGKDDGEEDSGTRPQPVLHRLTGHQGVIFSIFYNEGLQRICSVSDDRSIIMYQLHFHPSSEPVANDADNSCVDWNHVTIEPMLTVFGHSGRVWDVILLTDCFVSVGEDAHCIVWSYNGDILHKQKGHKGQSIWSLAASEDESFVVTGGGDCSIRKWQLCSNQDLPLIQVHLTIPDHVKTCADDFVRTLTLWDYDTVVLITNAGSILCYNIASDIWQILAYDTDFASYATLAVSPHTSFLAIASISGHVRMIRKAPDQPGSQLALHETKVKLHSGKVFGLTWVDDDHFLTTGLNGLCILAAVQQSSQGVPVVSTLAKLELPACKHRWVVSGCLLLMPQVSSLSSPSPQSGPWGHLVCGDRSGSVHCYQLTYSATKEESMLLPSQTFPKIHGSAGVTYVCHHNQTVYTAGRDGQYRRWSLNLGHLQLVNSSRVFKGFDWIDRLWIGDSGHFVLGFYSSKFIVWDVDQGERQMEVECGGGHRSWDCMSCGQNYRFFFIKAREVIMVTGGQRAAQDIVRPPLHGKKVLDIKCLFSYTDSRGAVQHVMCTGSEDTTLSLGVLQSDLEGGRLQWRGQHTLHAHLSSVRALAAVRSGHTVPDRDNKGDSEQSSNDPLHACSADSSLHLPRNRDTSSGYQVTSKVVFSAGGRAQIQAWRVTVVEKVSSSYHTVNEQGSGSHQTVTEQRHTSNQGNSSSQRSTEHDGSFHLSYNFRETSHCQKNKDSSFTTTYEHLSGCFLGESRHKRSHKPWKTRYLKLDPETRIMCLTAVAAQHLDSRLSAYLHLLAAAGSDGILRLFLFDEQHRHFILLCQSSHHSGCILKVLIHLHPCPPCPQGCSTLNTSTSPTDHLPILLSAATDGRITIWNLQPVVQWLLANAGSTLPDGHGCAASSHGSGNSVQLKATDAGDGVDPEKEETTSASCNQCQGQQDQEELAFDESSGDENDDMEEETLSHPATVELNFTSTQYLGAVPSLFLPPTLAGPSGVTESSAAKQKRDQISEEDGTHQSWTPDQEVIAHQSGVNSLCIKSLTDGSLLLASGGDDNALTIHRLTVIASGMGSRSNDSGLSHGGPLFSVAEKVCKPDAHAAQITGVSILSPTHILTASIDQRVNVWRLTQESQVTLERCRFVDVADPSNIDIWQHRDRVYVGLCGEGLALLSVNGYEADGKASV